MTLHDHASRSDVPRPPSPPADLHRCTSPLLWFFGLTFGLTWGVAALVLAAPGLVRALGGPFSAHHPLYFLAVYAPTLSGLVLTAVHGGRAALSDLFRRLLRWRVRPGYWLLVLLGWPVLDVAARLVEHLITGGPVTRVLLDGVVPTALAHWYLAPVFLLASLLLDAGPLGEEPGWRGYALPRMLAGRFGPLPVAITLGVVWGGWHLPAFLIAGTYQHDEHMGVLWLVLGTTLSSIIMTWLYLRTGGSVLLAGITVHLMNNNAGASLWATDLLFVVPAALAAWSLHRASGTGSAPRRSRTVRHSPRVSRPSSPPTTS